MSRIKSKKKSPEEVQKNKENIERRNKLFEEIWKERPHKCEVTGIKLYSPINSMYFHHILPKSKYPKFEFYKKNIILLEPNIHAQVESNMYRYEEINNRREELLKEYENNNN